MRRAIATIVPVVSTGVVIAGAALEGAPSDLMWVPLVAASSAVGALLWYRRAGRAIGPLLMLVGASVALDIGMLGYVHQARAHDLPGAPWVATAFQSAIGLSGAVYLIVQLFPTGRPLSPRWRALVWITAGSIVLSVVAPLLAVTSDFTQNFPDLPHPLHLVSPSVADQLVSLGGLGNALVFLASAVALVIRFRRATWLARAQMKWFTGA